MPQHQYRNLDGLRGLAALSVVLYHYTIAFAPFLLGVSVTVRHTRFDRLIATTPTQLPFAGTFAVYIFFVLSGFVLSLSFFRYKDTAVLVSSAARRYFRLMIPAFTSIILAYLVLRLGLVFTKQVIPITQSTWLAMFWSFPAHIGQAVFQGLYNVWFGVFNINTSYNPVLWTMHYELCGSFLLFLFLALFGKLHNRWLFYGVFGLVFLKTPYLDFVLGIALSDLISNTKNLDRLRDYYLWPLLFFGIVLGTWTTTGIYPTVYAHLHLPFFTDTQLQVTAQTVGASIIVLSALKLRLFSKLLETRPFQYLGKVSFALYLTHFIVMSSLASYLFYRLTPTYGYKVGIFATCIISFPITFLISSIFTRYVDVPSIAMSKRIGDSLVSDDNLFPNLKHLRLYKRFELMLSHRRS